ncbi:MAG TPA: KEOPS complex kinase/ATPase Bud32 [Candidatus Saccharimonadales bacterium]|nr:KEOPS complex kinase/ATPase Bud32 [Candidatus Saccharimonadales bacterium]
MIKLGEGAEAKIYLTRIFGRAVLLKRREPKKYRIRELDERLRRERTRAEARIMLRLSKAGIPAPRPVAVGRFSIYMEMLPGRLLKDARPGAETLRRVGRLLGAIHGQNIAHGDFTPANIMLSGKRIHIIDFGLSEVTNSQEEKALDLLLMKRALTKAQYAAFERSYSRSYSKGLAVINRLGEIERRGRYQIRTLA